MENGSINGLILFAGLGKKKKKSHAWQHNH